MNLDNLPGNEEGGLFNQPPDESVIIENEILMMKLNAEFGAQIFLPQNRASPEVENHFLRSVYAFEKQFAERQPRVKIADIIKGTQFPDASILTDEKLAEQLEKLRALLWAHKIVLDIIYEYSDRKIYRFITEEFFLLEIQYPGKPEYYMHFCYEDFHPNHENDVREAASLFVNYLMGLLTEVPQAGLHRFVIDRNGHLMGAAEAIIRIKDCCRVFTTRSLIEFNVRQLVVNYDAAMVRFGVKYMGKLANGDCVEVTGEGRFDFIYNADMWWIVALEFPGVII